MVNYSKQDAWALGYLLYLMLSPNPAAAPFTGGDVRRFTDDVYTPPTDVSSAFDDVPRAAQAVGGNIVRGLLAVAHARTATLARAVAPLEIALFCLVEGAAGGVDAAVIAARLSGLSQSLVGAGAGPAIPVSEVLLVDFLHSPRSEVGAVSATLAELMGRA